jgi:hypothetical protein
MINIQAAQDARIFIQMYTRLSLALGRSNFIAMQESFIDNRWLNVNPNEIFMPRRACS